MSESQHISTFPKARDSPEYIGPYNQSYMPAGTTSLERYFKHRVANHFLFWVVITLITAYYGSLYGGDFSDNLISMCTLLPVQILAAYAFVYVQIPRWLFHRRWALFIVGSIVLAYLLAILARLTVIYISEPLIGIIGEVDESIWEIISDPIYLIKVYVVTLYLPAVILFLIKMTKEKFVHQNRLERLEKEKRTTELSFLKAQMNPHFLFNTLNNIYALSSQGSEQTPDMILKLSEILDYTIYECQDSRVLLTREWQLIEDYADLQALRYSEPLKLLLRRDVDDPSAMIAPLILISIVENAFKYALRGAGHIPEINLNMEVKNRRLTFDVYNTRVADDKIGSADSKKGIGVPNIKRQLELEYPERHNLEIIPTSDSYRVLLKIDL